MAWCMNIYMNVSKNHGIATEYYCICPSSERYESMIPVHSGSLFQTLILFLDMLFYLHTEVAKQTLFPCTIY